MPRLCDTVLILILIVIVIVVVVVLILICDTARITRTFFRSPLVQLQMVEEVEVESKGRRTGRNLNQFHLTHAVCASALSGENETHEIAIEINKKRQ